jgi:hypothetical protein
LVTMRRIATGIAGHANRCFAAACDHDSVVLEVVIRGQHLGFWRGLPATGRHLEFPLCGIFTFDDSDRLAGERIYYDRATMLRQLGLLHELERMPGRVAAMLMHPVTMLRIISRSILRR